MLGRERARLEHRLQVAAVRTPRHRIRQFLLQCLATLSPGKLVLSFAVERALSPLSADMVTQDYEDPASAARQLFRQGYTDRGLPQTIHGTALL